MLTTIKETENFLRDKVKEMPDTAIILGSGLGGFTDYMREKIEIPYHEIPHFMASTVEGHSGKLVFGYLGEKWIMAMQGRFHYYEGYNMQAVTLPVRVMRALGVNTLFVSNAAGGLNPSFNVGDIMVLTDHINFFPEHPLRGKNEVTLGTRFPDMSQVYSARLIAKAKQIAKDGGIDLKEGVYVGITGPSYETPAESRFYRLAGGDAIGMSTVPEVIVARHGGMEVFAVSVITNVWREEVACAASHEEVQTAAQQAQPKMMTLMRELIAQP